MGMGKRLCTPSELFGIIKKARDNRVPVVPLIGAGLSLEAGVPTTTLMIDYMVKVKLLIDLGHRNDHEDMDYAHHLKEGGWPDPNELNDLILVGLHKHQRNLEEAPTWLRELVNPESHLVRTSGSLLGAVRLFTLHEYLQRAQPSLLGFMPRSGSCPVMAAMTDKMARVFARCEHAAARAGAGRMATPLPMDTAAAATRTNGWGRSVGRSGRASTTPSRSRSGATG